MKKTITIKEVDTNLWNWLVGYAKMKGRNVGGYIDEFIKDLKKKQE